MCDAIDKNYRIFAFNPINGKIYTEQDAFILRARDHATLPALLAYRDECARLGAAGEHIASVAKLYQRVKVHQETGIGRAVDWKFKFLAVNPTTCSCYTEANALVLCAKDKAVPAALEAYINDMRETQQQERIIERFLRLRERVVLFQEQVQCRVPDTVGEEIPRCLDGRGVQ